MSNNACRLLFRVGETHWIIHGQDSLSIEERHGGSWESYLRTGALCHSCADLDCHCRSNMGGTEGGRDLCSSPICRPPPHSQWVSRKDYRELAVPCLSSSSVCLRYSMCHAVQGGCQYIEKKKKSRLLFHNEIFCFSSEVRFCFGTLAMSIALKRLS